MRIRMFGKNALLSAALLFAAGVPLGALSETDAPALRRELENGIPVYYKRWTANQIAAVYIVAEGGIQYLDEKTSGLESALFSMMTKGSEKYGYDDVTDFMYRTMSGFSSHSWREGSALGVSCIDYYLDKAVDLLADGFLHPAFGQKEYGVLTEQYRQDLQAQSNDPVSVLLNRASGMIYEGHPYSVSASVRPESVDAVTVDAMRAYHRTLLDSRRISVVAAGRIDPDGLVAALNRTIGRIPAGTEPLKREPAPPVEVSGGPAVFSHPAAAGTAYILRVFAAPALTSPDRVPADIAADIFSGILFNVVREKYGACYSPDSFISGSAAPFGAEFLYRASNLTDFTAYMEEARGIMERQLVISGKGRDGFTFAPLADRLEGYVNSYVNQEYAAQNSTGGTALRMCASLLRFGDVTAADRMIDSAKNVTAADIARVFKKYWIDGSSRWFAVTGPDGEERIQF